MLLIVTVSSVKLVYKIEVLYDNDKYLKSINQHYLTASLMMGTGK